MSSNIFDCADVGTCGMLSIVTALEFFQHYFSEMGHRDLLVTQNLSQAIKQPTLHYLTRSVRRASDYVQTRLPTGGLSLVQCAYHENALHICPHQI